MKTTQEKTPFYGFKWFDLIFSWITLYKLMQDSSEGYGMSQIFRRSVSIHVILFRLHLFETQVILRPVKNK